MVSAEIVKTVEIQNIKGVAAIVIDSSKPGMILIVEEGQDDPNTGKKAGMFSLPAGHVELSETRDQSIKREIKEETGSEVKIIRILGTYTFRNIEATIYVAEVIGKSNFESSGEIRKCSWLTPKQLLEEGKLLRPLVRKIVQDWMRGK